MIGIKNAFSKKLVSVGKYIVFVLQCILVLISQFYLFAR